MKKKVTLVATAALGVSLASAVAQKLPGAPEDNGLTPKTTTFYVNSQATALDTVNNGNTESLGVAIANNGNVIVGWEDDAADASLTPLQDVEAVWSIFDSGGALLTTNTDVNSLMFPAAGILNSHFLSYFRADKSAVYGGTSWGPKIKANLFGNGLGMGASSFYLGEEVVEFAPWDDQNSGDFPSVQLLSNDGLPGRIFAGVSSEYAVRDPANIRIADWEYLSNSNIVFVGESRQDQELVSIYGGDTPAHHAIFRILNPTGGVAKAESLVSEIPIKSEIWHGAAVTLNGFAVRFAGPTGAIVRLFDNAGNPVSTNIDLAGATGFPLAGAGGRGDGAGFHGNGKDAYVHAAGGTDPVDSIQKVWVTVIDTNGTVRFSKSVAGDLDLTAVGGVDAAIDTDGKVIVVFEAKYDPANPTLVMGRRLDAAGNPIGGTFYISEKELPDPATLQAAGPRIAWRNNQVAVVWESKNDPGTLDPITGAPMPVVAARYFSTFTPGSIESVGLIRIVPDTPLIVPQTDALGNWEPYASVLGTSTFLIEGNTFAQGFDLPSPDGRQRYVVGLQPAGGGAMKLGEGFFDDAGQPYRGEINASRQNGNPGRVAGDTRPGATTFMVGGEASPHVYASAFGSDNRWNLGFDRLADGRYGTIQTFKLDPATLAQTSLCKAQDSANGRETTGTPAGSQISRYGGDVAGLDNGNFVSVVEDRGHTRSPSDCVTATIFAPDGSVVKESWVVVNSDIWANVAAFKGGFAIRAKPADGSATRVIYFYDNAGTLKGTVDQATSGVSFDTGRGDGTRIFGHINSPFVYLTGRAANTQIVKVAAFDSRNQQFIAVTDVNEGAFTGNFDRAFGAVDALNRLTVSWVSQPAGYAANQVAARVFAFNGTNYTALTRSFFPFINAYTNTIHTFQMSVAMTTRQVCVAAKGEINLQNKPELGPTTPKEVNFFTVISHPNPQDDPTAPVGRPQFTKAQVKPGTPPTFHLEWTGGGTLQLADDPNGQWQDMPGATSPQDIPIDRGHRFARIKQ